MARNTFKDDEILVQKFNFKYLLRILKYAVPFKWTFIGIFSLIILSSVVSLAMPLINGFLIETVIPGKDYKMLFLLIFIIFAIATSEIIVVFIQIRFLALAGHKIITKIRTDVFQKLQELSFDYYDNRPSGKIMIRVTNYVNELANFFANILVNFIINVIKILIVMAFMYALNLTLALVVTFTVIPLFVFVSLMRAGMESKLRVIRNFDSSRVAYAVENISGNFVTNSFNRKQQNLDIYLDLSVKTGISWLKFVDLNRFFATGIEFFWHYGAYLLYFVSILLLQKNLLGIATIVAFSGYLNTFNGPINTIAASFQQMANISSYVERIFDLMDADPIIKNKEGAEKLPEIVGDVKFENVNFGYEPNSFILENFNLDVKAGETIALVGPTGAGKSTVVNLISRFYDINGGKLTVDGKDVRDVTLHSLRSQMGIMLQDPFIFKGTVMENIKYGKLDATDEECINAAKSVFADEFIVRLPLGYYTQLNERGEGLSSGEKQLLSFARVMVKNPKILILDEATSSIDTETEKKIQYAMNNMLKGKTSFVIAHRLSTIKQADRILCIANKGIAESGSHSELMKRKGLYYSLAKKH